MRHRTLLLPEEEYPVGGRWWEKEFSNPLITRTHGRKIKNNPNKPSLTQQAAITLTINNLL